MARYQPGDHGNPKGRPRGVPDRRLRFRKELEKHGGELLEVAIKQALDGDTPMLKCLLERLIPKAESAPVALTVPTGGSLSDLGAAVLTALANGKLTPAEAARAMDAVTTQARLIEVDDFEQRLTALEQDHAGHLEPTAGSA